MSIIHLHFPKLQTVAFFCKLLQECSSQLVPWTNFYTLFQIQDLNCALQLFDFEVQTILFFFFKGWRYLLYKWVAGKANVWWAEELGWNSRYSTLNIWNIILLYLLHLSYSFYTVKLNCSPGIGGFLPGVKQIANVAALPGIVGVRMIITFSCWNYNLV